MKPRVLQEFRDNLDIRSSEQVVEKCNLSLWLLKVPKEDPQLNSPTKVNTDHEKNTVFLSIHLWQFD